MSMHDHEFGTGAWDSGRDDAGERLAEPRRAALKQLLLEQVAADSPAARPIEPAAPARPPSSHRYARHLAAAASLATLAGLGGAALLGLTGQTSAQAETVHCYAQAPTASHEHAVRSVPVEIGVPQAGADAAAVDLAARAGCWALWQAEATEALGGLVAGVPDLVACRDAVGTVLVFPGARGDCVRRGFDVV